MTTNSYQISAAGIQRFNELRYEAIDSVSLDFYAKHSQEYARFGERSHNACREDIEFHLDFLRPVLESGMLEPYVDYLHWFTEVLATRNIPINHIVETINWIGEFFRDHIKGGDGEIIANALSAACELAQHSKNSFQFGESVTAKWPDQDALEAALLQGNRSAAIAIVDRLRRAGHSLMDIEVDLIEPALVSVGLKWQRNEISVAQEHLATATAQTLMADAFSKTTLPPLNGKKVLLACVETNQHSVGLRMIADAFELGGWEVEFLGANVPNRSLVEMTKASAPDLIGLSISLLYQIHQAREAIQSLRAQMGAKVPPVIVGGLTVNRYHALAYLRVGADGYARNALLALPSAMKLCISP